MATSSYPYSYLFLIPIETSLSLSIKLNHSIRSLQNPWSHRRPCLSRSNPPIDASSYGFGSTQLIKEGGVRSISELVDIESGLMVGDYTSGLGAWEPCPFLSVHSRSGKSAQWPHTARYQQKFSEPNTCSYPTTAIRLCIAQLKTIMMAVIWRCRPCMWFIFLIIKLFTSKVMLLHRSHQGLHARVGIEGRSQTLCSLH